MIQTVADDLRIADELFDGMTRRGRAGSRQRHRPVCFAAECDGPEDFPFVRTIGNASHLVSALLGTAGDKHPDQASNVVV